MKRVIKVLDLKNYTLSPKALSAKRARHKQILLSNGSSGHVQEMLMPELRACPRLPIPELVGSVASGSPSSSVAFSMSKSAIAFVLDESGKMRVVGWFAVVLGV